MGSNRTLAKLKVCYLFWSRLQKNILHHGYNLYCKCSDRSSCPTSDPHSKWFHRQEYYLRDWNGRATTSCIRRRGRLYTSWKRDCSPSMGHCLTTMERKHDHP